jgi:hypothetical protein
MLKKRTMNSIKEDRQFIRDENIHHPVTPPLSEASPLEDQDYPLPINRVISFVQVDFQDN